MDQCIRALALAEDPSLVPNPHIGYHTAGCNFSFGETSPGTCTHEHTSQRYSTYTHN